MQGDTFEGEYSYQSSTTPVIPRVEPPGALERLDGV